MTLNTFHFAGEFDTLSGLEYNKSYLFLQVMVLQMLHLVSHVCEKSS